MSHQAPDRPTGPEIIHDKTTSPVPTRQKESYPPYWANLTGTSCDDEDVPGWGAVPGRARLDRTPPTGIPDWARRMSAGSGTIGRGEDTADEVEPLDDPSSLEEELEETSSPRCRAALRAILLAVSSFFRARAASFRVRFASRCLTSLGKEEPRGTLSRLPSL